MKPTENSIFDKIKKYLFMKFKWFKKNTKKSFRVNYAGDIYVKSKDIFSDKEESIKYLKEVAELTGFKINDGKL
ncbi:hypothetical protein [Flavobacterium succinicans]|uniref:Uncharacterized protein n=1 Tax=Flavobacterium succinicans TaxID=29536 RepID=A0A199XT34_9FLAO|nr:hypothetical protein [Flavobacterium succinicans]OAZ04494.1 hypothetical protein FLB_11080 [Flavobacterium succinicans]